MFTKERVATNVTHMGVGEVAHTPMQSQHSLLGTRGAKEPYLFWTHLEEAPPLELRSIWAAINMLAPCHAESIKIYKNPQRADFTKKIESAL